MQFHHRAVTLIEVLLAIVLLAFGLFGVVDMYVHTARQVDGVRLQARLAGVTEGHLAQLQASGYHTLDAWMRRATVGETSDAVELFPRPRGSSLDADFVWNARLSRIEVSNRPAIEIAVQTRFYGTALPEPDQTASIEAGQPPTHGRARRLSKEATGYVFVR